MGKQPRGSLFPKFPWASPISSSIFKMPKTRRSAGVRGEDLRPLLSIEQPAELKPTFGFFPYENQLSPIRKSFGFSHRWMKIAWEPWGNQLENQLSNPVLRRCGSAPGQCDARAHRAHERRCGLAQCIPGCTPDVGAFYGPKISPGTLWSAPASAMFLTFRESVGMYG